VSLSADYALLNCPPSLLALAALMCSQHEQNLVAAAPSGSASSLLRSLRHQFRPVPRPPADSLAAHLAELMMFDMVLQNSYFFLLTLD
jgi:hypothetical protein